MYVPCSAVFYEMYMFVKILTLVTAQTYHLSQKGMVVRCKKNASHGAYNSTDASKSGN